MRWLILSDPHSNLEALEAVLSAAEGQCDRIVCLGDLVGYGPDPNAVVEWARQAVATCIRGNHDKAACDPEAASDFNYAARIAAQWTHERLSEENHQYLRQLPPGPLQVEGFEIVHGAPSDEDKYIVTQPDALMELDYQQSWLTFFGHSHHQGGYLQDEEGSLREVKPSLFRGCSSVALELLPGEKYLLNPGSVGQPRDGDVRAAFCIYDPARRAVQYWRVPYAVEATQQRMEELGLPESLVQRLGFGH